MVFLAKQETRFLLNPLSTTITTSFAPLPSLISSPSRLHRYSIKSGKAEAEQESLTESPS